MSSDTIEQGRVRRLWKGRSGPGRFGLRMGARTPDDWIQDESEFADEFAEQLASTAPEPTERLLLRRPPPKRNYLLDRWGFYEDRANGSWTTTRQAEGLNLATNRRVDGGAHGLLTGVYERGRAPIFVDPFELYTTIDLANINVCLVGDIGKAKSSMIKTNYVYRPLIFRRQVVVIDKKRQGSSGEYSILAEHLGVGSIRFVVGGGGACINLLDPDISADGARAGRKVNPASQLQLVLAVLADTMARPLTDEEISAVGRALWAVTTDCKNRGVVPTLPLLADELLDPKTSEEVREHYYGSIWAKESRRWGRAPGLAIRRLCEEDLRGLVDSETSPEIKDALNHPFVHFDISALPTEGPALRVVMLVINTWLANLLADRATNCERTYLIIEEGWHVAQGSTGRVFRENMKLSRGLGLCTVSAFHHISDHSKDSPSRALMQESGIVHLYGQDRYVDAKETAEMYHLPPGAIDVILRLARGRCLVKIGTRDPVFVRHLRSGREVVLTDTDSQIRGAAA